MAEWAVGIYEDEPERVFVGVYGASICAIDNLTTVQAVAIVQLHNREVAELDEKIASYRKAYEQAVETAWQGDSVRLPDLDDMLVWIEEKETSE